MYLTVSFHNQRAFYDSAFTSFTRETHLCDSGDDTGEVRSQTTLPSSTGNTGNINSNSPPSSSTPPRSTNQPIILHPIPSVQPSTLLPPTSSDPAPDESQKPSRFANLADSDLFRRLLNYKLDKLRSYSATPAQQSQSSKQSTSFDSYTYSRIGQNEDDDFVDDDDNEDDYDYDDDEDDEYYYEKVLFSFPLEFSVLFQNTHPQSVELARFCPVPCPVDYLPTYTVPPTRTHIPTSLSASLDIGLDQKLRFTLPPTLIEKKSAHLYKTRERNRFGISKLWRRVIEQKERVRDHPQLSC